MKIKLKQITSTIIFSLFFIFSTGVFAAPMFNISTSGLTLQISPKVPRTYTTVGIKVNTPGYSLANPGGECTPYKTGYCLFSMSPSAPKTITLTGRSRIGSDSIDSHLQL